LAFSEMLAGGRCDNVSSLIDKIDILSAALSLGNITLNPSCTRAPKIIILNLLLKGYRIHASSATRLGSIDDVRLVLNLIILVFLLLAKKSSLWRDQVNIALFLQVLVSFIANILVCW